MNAPRSWPKSSDSSRSFGIAAVLIATNGSGGARAVPVQRARDELLAGAGFAGDEHRRVRLRQAADRAEHLLHRGRLARAFPAPRRARRSACAPARRFGRRAADQRERVVDVERLRQVLVGAALERRDRAVEIRIRGHDDHRHVRVARLHLVEQLPAPTRPACECRRRAPAARRRRAPAAPRTPTRRTSTGCPRA